MVEPRVYEEGEFGIRIQGTALLHCKGEKNKYGTIRMPLQDI